MSDLIDREALLRQIDIDSEGEPGYYGDTWKFIDTIKRMPSALSTNLAEVGTEERITKGFPIDADLLMMKVDEQYGDRTRDRLYDIIRKMPKYELPPIQPAEPQIIRCKDCKNWDTTWTNDFSPNYHYCPMVDGVRKEDWFCADAERKTE